MNLGPPGADESRTGLLDLVGGDPPWTDPGEADAPPYSSLEKDADCEVVVLGAGVTGAMCAALLVDEGLDVMLVDKRSMAAGSTCANTALLLFEPDQPLCRLAEMLGEDDAGAVYRLCHRALDGIARLADRLVGDGAESCFHWRSSLMLASRPEDVELLRQEHEIRRRHGYPTSLLDRSEIESRYAFSAPGALWAKHAAQMNPRRFTRGLIADAARRGLRAHERTNIVAHRPGRDRVELTTDQGRRLRARRVVFATGYETERYTRRQLALDNATFAILTELLGEMTGWPDRPLLWETANPYIYVRSTENGRILIGGLDEPTLDADRRDAMLPEKSQRLLQRLRQLFPDIDPKIARAWTGTFLNTRDSLPYIGQLPGEPRSWFALAYGGNGTTFGMIAAEMTRDAILGRPRDEARLFRFDRPTAREKDEGGGG